MAEVQNTDLPPQWLRVLQTKEFYGHNKYCKTHQRQYETYFCIDCMGDPLCKKCWQESVHKDHHTVQVFSDTGKASMRIEDLNGIWSVQNIQPYKINSRTVVYLHERPNKAESGCILCKGVIKNEETYKFCSIECKMKSIINNDNRVFEPREDNDAPQSSLNGRLSNGSQQVNRPNEGARYCHRRKDLPTRAPLY